MGRAITRAVEDQYQLGMRLGAHVGDLQSAIEILEQRCALRPGETAAADTSGDGGGRRRRPRRGYATAGGSSPKRGGWRRCGSAWPPRKPISPPGIRRSRWAGERLWRTRQNLGAAGIDEFGWQARWDAARLLRPPTAGVALSEETSPSVLMIWVGCA